MAVRFAFPQQKVPTPPHPLQDLESSIFSSIVAILMAVQWYLTVLLCFPNG